MNTKHGKEKKRKKRKKRKKSMTYRIFGIGAEEVKHPCDEVLEVKTHSHRLCFGYLHRRFAHNTLPLPRYTHNLAMKEEEGRRRKRKKEEEKGRKGEKEKDVENE